MNYSDPKTYREMSIPFASNEEASKANEAFKDELATLRKKYRMRDLVVVAQFSYESSEGECDAVSLNSFGHAGNVESLLAYALGVTQTERQQHNDRLLRAIKTGKRE